MKGPDEKLLPITGYKPIQTKPRQVPTPVGDSGPVQAETDIEEFSKSDDTDPAYMHELETFVSHSLKDSDFEMVLTEKVN
jgi:BioD-like phosphotransacetylase family protein